MIVFKMSRQIICHGVFHGIELGFDQSPCGCAVTLFKLKQNYFPI